MPTKRDTAQCNNPSQAKRPRRFFGDYGLSAVTPELVAAYRDKRRLEERRAANTVRVELALLSDVFEMAIREWRLGLTLTPARAICWPAPGAGRDRRLAADEEQRLLKACNAYSNPMRGWMVHLALNTGMRAGEIQRLRRRDVDLTRRTVTLRDTKNREARAVPLVPAALATMEQALSNPIRPIDTDLVFFGEPGRDGKRRGFEYKPVWRQIKTRLGMSDLRFHDLRHQSGQPFR